MALVAVFFAAMSPGSSNDSIRLNPGRHYGTHLAIAFSADGSTIVTLGEESSLRVWDVKTGKQIRELWLPRDESERQRQPVKLWLTPDGKTAIVPFYTHKESRGNLAVIPLDDSGTYRVIGGNTQPVEHLAISRDGLQIATSSGTTPIRIWQLATGKQICKIDHDQDLKVFGLAFTPDGKQVTARLSLANVRGELKSNVSSFDSSRGTLAQRFEYVREGYAHPEWSPDGKLLAVHYNTGAVDLFTDGGRLKRSLKGTFEVRRYISGFDHEGRFLSAIGTERGFNVRDETAGSSLVQVAVSDKHAANFIAGGRQLANFTDISRFELSILELNSGKAISHLHLGGMNRFTGLEWDKSSQKLAWYTKPMNRRDPPELAAGFDLNKFAVLNLVSNKLIHDKLKWGDTTLTVGDYTASATIKDKLVKFNYEVEYDFESIQEGTLVGPKDAVLATSAKGLIGYDVATGRKTPTYSPFEIAYYVAVSPNGKHFAAANNACPVISLFKIGTWTPVLYLVCHNTDWFAWTPEGIWDASEGGNKLVGTLTKPEPGKTRTFVPMPSNQRDAAKVRDALK